MGSRCSPRWDRLPPGRARGQHISHHSGDCHGSPACSELQEVFDDTGPSSRLHAVQHSLLRVTGCPQGPRMPCAVRDCVYWGEKQLWVPFLQFLPETPPNGLLRCSCKTLSPQTCPVPRPADVALGLASEKQDKHSKQSYSSPIQKEAFWKL